MKGSVNYRCPKPNCGARVDEMSMIWGGIRKEGAMIRAKMQIKCNACGGMHTVRLTGERAMKVFMALQGTDRIERVPERNSWETSVLRPEDRVFSAVGDLRQVAGFAAAR